MALGSTTSTTTATAAATTKTTALNIQVLDNQRRRRVKIWIPKWEIQGQELDRYLRSSRQQGVGQSGDQLVVLQCDCFS